MSERPKIGTAPLAVAERLVMRLFCGDDDEVSDKTVGQLLTSTHPIACDVCDAHIDLDPPDNKPLVDEAFEALEHSIARTEEVIRHFQ